MPGNAATESTQKKAAPSEMERPGKEPGKEQSGAARPAFTEDSYEFSTIAHAQQKSPFPVAAENDHAHQSNGSVNHGDMNPEGIQASESKSEGTNSSQLTEKEEEQVEKLQARDVEVKTHEMAHKNAAGQYARGGPNYVYQTGPDGRRYAVGGSVQIDTSEVKGNPRKTVEKMQVVKRAALAPAEPSSQDRKVAAMATQRAAKAQAELAKESTEPKEQKGHNEQTGKIENEKKLGVENNENQVAPEAKTKSGQKPSDASTIGFEIFISEAQQSFQGSGQLVDIKG